MSQPVPPGEQQQRELVWQLGRALTARLAPGWREVRIRYQAAGRHVEVDLLVTGPDGTPRPDRPAPDVVNMLATLRSGMYQPGRGTWLVGELVMRPGAELPDTSFGYDQEPRWRRVPPPIGFRDELGTFPRADEHIPAWLRQRLAAGEGEAPQGAGLPGGGPGGSPAGTQAGTSGPGSHTPPAGSPGAPFPGAFDAGSPAASPAGGTHAGPPPGTPAPGSPASPFPGAFDAGSPAASPAGGTHAGPPPGTSAPGSPASPFPGAFDSGSAAPPPGSHTAAGNAAPPAAPFPGAPAGSPAPGSSFAGAPDAGSPAPPPGSPPPGSPSFGPPTPAPSSGPSNMRTPRIHDGFNQSGRPVVRRVPLSDEERERVLSYLDGAPVVLAARGYGADAFDPDGAANVPLNFRTDGNWVWPGAVAYYLRVHSVTPDPDLVEHIRARQFVVPEVDEPAREMAIAAITGGDELLDD